MDAILLSDENFTGQPVRLREGKGGTSCTRGLQILLFLVVSTHELRPCLTLEEVLALRQSQLSAEFIETSLER